MSTRTRTWSTAIPVDHTQIKLGPTKVRDLRTDIEERVDGILAGFVNTGTTNGLLLGRLLTVGTASTAYPGTGAAAAIDIFGMTTNSLVEVFIRTQSSNEIQLTEQGRLMMGKLRNDQYIVGVGTGGGNVNILKVNTASVVEFGTGALVPSGGIIIWSGASNAIPAGWLLCDGNNSTPNLTNRFVIGAGATYAVGVSSGATTHTLLTAEMPAHTHDTKVYYGESANLPKLNAADAGATLNNTFAGALSTGGDGAHNNMPPYYALCYIMKT